ncbi:UDP-glucose--hexose-1-phosphate uridylyltransferase [Dokdonia donghaensis]|uniref:Galactose-1-phosphate uridylyltransferase n=1 Tax=Dokdonia donghaensis DSW-1 TaxID=1300343 RepID=A0A0A2H459_9FLAO|nr:UDP-glucose--hexose-1-phosphate uridylyltransferase [Dokdonia donghaensis]ANH60106.1 Galactose-1-phosphate uridylyltransferase [Dokdonia donghaensis DSW-1]KGO07405.1 galactose-1-phosphate uridylyltransferase [Dokdonia donghaensis DSW-1]
MKLESPHRRYNILTGDWILVSPHRTKRPWQGKSEKPVQFLKVPYDEDCYLCPTNTRASGNVNPDYSEPFAFNNDFAALIDLEDTTVFKDGFLMAQSESGICRVVCFAANHSLTLPLMEASDIERVILLWQKEYRELGSKKEVNHVQIFENKGAMMGCSNPHPHGQIWAQNSIPEEVAKKTERQKSYFENKGVSLLGDYIKQELQEKERVVYENDHFVAIVPYWAVWPYETMIVPKRHVSRITDFTDEEVADYALVIKVLTTKYDNIFKTSFPYSSGIHQAPTDGQEHPEWHLHMSFYPPLLRSATVKKFMVGYELFANPQRDISAEQAAQTIREQSDHHYLIDV